MTSTDARRRDNSAKPKGRARKEGSRKELEMTDTDKSAATLFSFIIDSRTAQLVKLESLDASGAGHELSEGEKLNLAKALGDEGIGEILEEAFEAGIACVLGDGDRRPKSQESAEDAELRHLLLEPLIAGTSAKRLLQPDVLHRAILETLIHDSIKQTAAARDSRPTSGVPADDGASSRTN